MFAGQGAQTPGMACELQSPRIKELFAAAESVRPGITALMKSGTMEELSKTVNTQPGMFVADLAYAYAAEDAGMPSAVCGFSVGEVPALAYAGAISVTDGLRIICKRAELMQKACDRHGGAMLAAVGLTPDDAEKAARSVPNAWAANYNAPKQTVIAVSAKSESALMAEIAALGGRAIKLKVSGAFHCPLLGDASAEFGEFLRSIPFAEPNIPVYANLTAEPYESGDAAAETLAKQMCSPVRFVQTIRNMTAAGIDEFVEVGPGKVLTGLVAKIKA